MKTKLVIDGNAFYEIDEECMRRKEEYEKQNQKEDAKASADNKTQEA